MSTENGVKTNYVLDATTKEIKYIAQKGDKSDLVREINLRLMGFGGGMPSEEYNEYTNKVVKQFKKDYMKQTNPDGTFVDMPTIEAIDKFGGEYPITSEDFKNMKCPCKKCEGYGYSSIKKGKKEYKKKIKDKVTNKVIRTEIREYDYTEYPGIHIGMFWILRGIKYYFKENGYYIFKVESGYRCSIDNTNNDMRGSQNHMGNAIDIHIGITKLKARTTDIKTIDSIRKNILMKEMGFQMRWNKKNMIALESIGDGCTTWIHFDIREYDESSKKTFFYVNQEDLACTPKTLKSLIK